MDISEPENVEKWAAKTFGAVECGDQRRTDRLIKVASALAKNPAASLPCASETWGETAGAYRFLGNSDVRYEQILSPHWAMTYHEASECPRTLLLGDTTEMDFSTHKAVKGLAPIGNSKEDIGFSVHTVLAMNPQTQQLLGCMTQEPFFRKLVPKGETRAERKKRERESQVWERSVKQIGRVPQDLQWIYVGDSGSDIYAFWQTCEDLGYDFAIRVVQDRVVEIAEEDIPEDGKEHYLKTQARALPATAAQFLTIPAHCHQPKREVFLQLSFQKVHVQPPTRGTALHETALTAWVIRVWEKHPPEGVEALEWIIVTTIPIQCPGDAWEVVQWYRWRWLLEDFHKALKTGCRIEQRYFQDVKTLWNVLAVLTPIALRLLLIRQTAQQDTEMPATEVVSQDIVRVVILLDTRRRDIVTARQLWHAIARLGGYLDRTGDGPPGWQTLWRGWIRVMNTLEGVHLATHFSSS